MATAYLKHILINPSDSYCFSGNIYHSHSVKRKKTNTSFIFIITD